jgi:hypothetical protein
MSLFLGSCGTAGYATPVGSFEMVAPGTTATEFLAIAEDKAGELQYIRAHWDGNRTMSVTAEGPRRGMVMGPGTTEGVYWVSSHVWSGSDLPKGCADLLAMRNALQTAFPSAEFAIDSANCPVGRASP